MAATGASPPDVLVVGGGLIGLLAARAIARAGPSVELVDDGQPGAASPAAAGMIAPIAESSSDAAFARLALESRDLWRQLAPKLEEESGATLDYDASGAILPVLDAAGRRVLAGIADQARELGEEATILDGDAVHDLVPDLAPQVDEALLLPGEHRVDNRLATAAAAEALKRRGVPLHRARIHRVAEDPASRSVSAIGPGFERSAGSVVICAGAWTPDIAGLPAMPIRPVKGQMIAFDGVDWPFTGAVRTPGFYAVRRAGGRLLIGASVEHTGFDLGLSDEIREELAGAAALVLPSLGDRRPVEQWAGLRPATPDGWPIVGPLGDRLFIASGHFRNGILLAPLTANMIAAAVLERPVAGVARPSSRMAPQRF